MRHILTIIMVLLLASCATKRIENTVTLRDTIRIMQHDSTYVLKHDSVYVNQWQKGDTVFRTEYRERIQYRDRLRVDTFYQHKTDTITKTVEVKKGYSLPWYARFAICVWTLLSVIAVGALIMLWVLGKYRK